MTIYSTAAFWGISEVRVASLANIARLKEVVIKIPGLKGTLEIVSANSNRPSENIGKVDLDGKIGKS